MQSVAEQLMAHLADINNTESLPVENDEFVGLYTFVKYGEARLVYRAYEPKTTDGQGYNPFTAVSIVTGKRTEMALTGIAWGDALYKLTDMYDPFIPQINDGAKIVSFDDYCSRFSDFVTERLQEQTNDPNIKVMVYRDEYLDYLARKVDEKTLIDYCRARLVLEDMAVTDWHKDDVIYAKDEMTRVKDECIINGTPIATANIWLPANHATYPAYIVEREEEDGSKVYDACIRVGDVVTPLGDNAVGFKREIDARHRGEMYFAAIAIMPCKPELGRREPAKQNDSGIDR